jgi:hypothetical protein
MFIGLTNLARRAKFLVNDNSTTILTGMGVTGTVTTAVLTGRASFRAFRRIHEEELIMQSLVDDTTNGDVTPKPELSTVTKVGLVWRYYLPPFGTGVTTITCIIMANKIATKQLAALAVASGISERALQEYKAKVIEKIGNKQDVAIRDEIAQERVNRDPVTGREMIIAGAGEVLCYDMLTGRYFQSTVENIKRAENKINHTLNNHMYASLSEFFEEIGLAATTFSDSVGWNSNEMCEVTFSTVMSSDQRPCVAIDFVHPPFWEYARLHG